MTYDELAQTGYIDRRAPRYTSYPPATVFARVAESSLYERALGSLSPDDPISVYVHIPFCERLCWFCACRTQGTRNLKAVDAYVDTVIAELAMVAKALPAKMRMSKLHWGGGTPTILPPRTIHRLAEAIFAVFEKTDGFEFSVEIDPTLVDQVKIDMLHLMGMARASIGVQDFDPAVQDAIGRAQTFETTAQCVDQLRRAGIHSLNIDLVYGLPRQTETSFARTLQNVCDLDPDRLSLFGYAHVPHMAKRQRLISEADLPEDRARFALFQQAQDAVAGHGMRSIGIDHFAKPNDSLLKAAQNKTLRRNFQGYTDDMAAALIGFGASAISRVGGYFQSAPATAAYNKGIEDGRLPIHRQHVWTKDDRLRGRIIEMLLCDYAVDLQRLVAEFGPIGDLRVEFMACAANFPGFVTFSKEQLKVLPEGRPIVRIIAQSFDAYAETPAHYSRVS